MASTNPSLGFHSVQQPFNSAVMHARTRSRTRREKDSDLTTPSTSTPIKSPIKSPAKFLPKVSSEESVAKRLKAVKEAAALIRERREKEKHQDDKEVRIPRTMVPVLQGLQETDQTGRAPLRTRVEQTGNIDTPDSPLHKTFAERKAERQERRALLQAHMQRLKPQPAITQTIISTVSDTVPKHQTSIKSPAIAREVEPLSAREKPRRMWSSSRRDVQKPAWTNTASMTTASTTGPATEQPASTRASSPPSPPQPVQSPEINQSSKQFERLRSRAYPQSPPLPRRRMQQRSQRFKMPSNSFTPSSKLPTPSQSAMRPGSPSKPDQPRSLETLMRTFEKRFERMENFMDQLINNVAAQPAQSRPKSHEDQRFRSMTQQSLQQLHEKLERLEAFLYHELPVIMQSRRDTPVDARHLRSPPQVPASWLLLPGCDGDDISSKVPRINLTE